MNRNDPIEPLTPIFAQPQFVHEYNVNVPQERIDAILARVKTARLPRQMPPPTGAKSAWETGMDTQWLEGLRQYWIDRYDWRMAETRLNSYPQYMARVAASISNSTTLKAKVITPCRLCLRTAGPARSWNF
jgi:epoxide hydrolase-like protein